MKIYLAGPDVFLPDAIEIGRRKAAICARHGLRGLYPLDNAVDLSAADASLAIFKGNEAMMDAADAIIANLTPFRGPSADAGTVYELGYMACPRPPRDRPGRRDRRRQARVESVGADRRQCRIIRAARAPLCLTRRRQARRRPGTVSDRDRGPCLPRRRRLHRRFHRGAAAKR